MRMLRYRDLASAGVPYSRQHLARLEREGKFPKKTKLNGYTVAWPAEEVDAWVAQWIAQRDALEKAA